MENPSIIKQFAPTFDKTLVEASTEIEADAYFYVKNDFCPFPATSYAHAVVLMHSDVPRFINIAFPGFVEAQKRPCTMVRNNSGLSFTSVLL